MQTTLRETVPRDRDGGRGGAEGCGMSRAGVTRGQLPPPRLCCMRAGRSPRKGLPACLPSNLLLASSNLIPVPRMFPGFFLGVLPSTGELPDARDSCSPFSILPTSQPPNHTLQPSQPQRVFVSPAAPPSPGSNSRPAPKAGVTPPCPECPGPASPLHPLVPMAHSPHLPLPSGCFPHGPMIPTDLKCEPRPTR